MTRDEIIELAKQADVWVVGQKPYQSQLERFAELVAQHEREACAIVCDDINAKYKWPDDVAERVASQWCADAIRAKS